jgi:hypothetical protein
MNLMIGLNYGLISSCSHNIENDDNSVCSTHRIKHMLLDAVGRMIQDFGADMFPGNRVRRAASGVQNNPEYGSGSGQRRGAREILATEFELIRPVTNDRFSEHRIAVTRWLGFLDSEFCSLTTKLRKA